MKIKIKPIKELPDLYRKKWLLEGIILGQFYYEIDGIPTLKN